MSARNFNIHVRTKKQGVIKVEDLGGGLVAVDYRGTKIVIEQSHDTIKLNSNGWYSATTKTAMNRYFSERNLPLSVYQKDFKWYVSQNGKITEYSDNMEIKL